MSRKHFIAIAAMLRAYHDAGDDMTAIASDMAHVFASANPRFDRARFMHAATGAPAYTN